MQIRLFHTVAARVFAASFLSALALVLSMLLPATVLAQQTDGDFEGEKTRTDKAGNPREIAGPSSWKKNRLRLLTIIREGKWPGENEEEMVQDCLHYYVRALTWKENLANLPAMRKELKKQLINAGKAPAAEVHDRFNALALQVCGEVAKDARYPRAVRFNCMLMVGELDEREYNAGANQKASPLPAATSLMIETASDAKQSVPLRLAAVIGLKRHTEYGIAPALQGKAAEALLAAVQQPVAKGADRVGQIWLRMAISDLLQTMTSEKIVVDQTKFSTSLAALVADETLPSWARAKLAGDLGRLDGRNLPAARLAPTVRSLAGLMLAISQASPFIPDEAAPEAEEEEETPPKATGRKGPRKKADEKKDEKAAPPSNAAPQEVEVASPAAQKLSSEEMIWELSQIRLALIGKDAPVGRETGPSKTNGLRMAADDAVKATIDKIVEHLDLIVPSLAGVPDNLDELADTLRSANQDLEGVLSSPAAEQAQAPKANKPGVARTRPQGNAPAGASTVSE